jgi:hypothetical protein
MSVRSRKPSLGCAEANVRLDHSYRPMPPFRSPADLGRLGLGYERPLRVRTGYHALSLAPTGNQSRTRKSPCNVQTCFGPGGHLAGRPKSTHVLPRSNP